ncbi:MAG: hypothetical protein EA402_13275 [Planctomycetota bacterium]|nr:MAG: hypothetical protein EA402_13275 [Planctomycetota bacterium]
MAALPIGTQSLWYHGTSRSAAAAIWRGGFRRDAGGGWGHWYGVGVYVSDRCADAAEWAYNHGSDGVVIVCRLAPGVRLDAFSQPDPAHLAALCRRYGPAILGKHPWKILPANKHLSRRDWAALYAYHVHHPDNHIGTNTPREPWFTTMNRIRSAIARCTGGGLYRTHGDDPHHPTSCEAVIFDPAQVIPVRMHRIITGPNHGVSMGPALNTTDMVESPPPGTARERQAWDALLVLQDHRAWNHREVGLAIAAVAAYGDELSAAPANGPSWYNPWDSILSELAATLIHCGRRFTSQRLLSRLHAVLSPHPVAFQRRVWQALYASAQEHSEGSTAKAGGRNWSEFRSHIHHRLRSLSPKESAP